MKVTIDQLKPSKVVEQIAEIFNTQFVNIGGETNLEIPPNFGSGFVRGIDFVEGIRLFVYDANLKSDLMLQYASQQQPLRIIFTLNGKLVHVMEPDHFRYNLKSFEGAIAASTDSHAQSIMLPAQTKTSFISLEIDRKFFYPKIKHELDTVPDNFANVFTDTENKVNFLYQGEYSLIIAEILNDIITNNYQGFVRKVYLESKALDLLSMKIKQYQDDLKEPSQRQILRKEDVKLIVDARKILEKNYENPPTIKELAKMLGTNDNKLMKGFRKILNKTVNDTIAEIRMNQAKLLLADGNYSLKEIAHKVGYKNPSNFTRRFKEKFGILPKFFAKKYQLINANGEKDI